MEGSLKDWREVYRVREANKSDQANISMAAKETLSRLVISLVKPTVEVQLECHRVPPPIIPLYTDILTVHLFLHSHMDLSWLDTFPETYLRRA